ncbi:hypothetical protein OVA24_12345 [Luteolibacter sp. SL250]|uniref:hypothetical protein n=1 Tax=Luteolibacter sp. SL250 TaxID=2995170 RepID=UPI00226E5C79|nr:hypothetical protein [Luteolibacter sp. SL250]WAC18029.1 hypothetical protein OVA24_12345 [Luteolibacter sp. SL250]
MAVTALLLSGCFCLQAEEALPVIGKPYLGKEGYMEAEISNPTKRTFVYSGFSESVPMSTVELLRDGKWVSGPIWDCGTGLRWIEISPEAKRVVRLPMLEQMPAGDALLRMRFVFRVDAVGDLKDTSESHTAYSEEFRLPLKEEKSPAE